MTEKSLILLANDDGVFSHRLAVLCDTIKSVLPLILHYW